MDIFLNAALFTDYVNFVEVTDENATKVETLDGSLYVDQLNYKRKWTIGWELKKSTEVDTITEIYNTQRSTRQFVRLRVPSMDIDTFAYMEVSEKKIRYSNTYIDGFVVTLTEQSAIS